MDGYIKKSEAVDVIVKYPYNIAGKTATAIRMIENLPSADVVPKSEVDLYRKQVDELEDELASTYDKLENAKAEIETLKDNNEHLAVMLEEAKTEVERLQAEKDALIKNYAECMKDYASEIFAEIERIILDNTYPDFDREHKPVNIWKAKTGYDALDELKKKYTEGEDKPAATEEKYFSPEDVRKMTNQEVREKYTAIRKSMERW